MIELTEGQVHALEHSEGAPLRLMNPRTQAMYVLLPADEYERLKEDGYDDTPWTKEELQALAWEAGQRVGWDDMDGYDEAPGEAMKCGDVVLVRFPHPSGQRGKKRPALIVQSDAYSGVVSTFVVAEVTSNLAMASDPACLFIDTSTPEGQATGLVRDSVISCLVLVMVYEDTVAQVLGTLSPAMRLQLDACLRAALELP